MSRPSQVIVIVEDDRHKQLVYRYMLRCGLKAHQIRIERSPSGAGSAESWVRKRFVKEVSAYRNRQHRAETALIVIVDSDTYTVQDRLGQLNQALKESEKPVVGAQEQIARLIPKRNVETWILCLNQEAVDEETDYKKSSRNWNELTPAAAEMLFAWAKREIGLPTYCIDSLKTGVEELGHLRF